MNDTFLPGSGFDTYESQDKVLMQMDGSTEAAVAVRICSSRGLPWWVPWCALPRSRPKPHREPKKPPRRWGSSASC